MLALVNTAAMKKDVQVSFQEILGVLWIYIYISRNVMLDHMIALCLDFLRNLYIDSSSGYTNLFSYHSHMANNVE